MPKEQPKVSRRALSPREVAELYPISEGTLANLRYNREGPKFFKVGKRKVVYYLEDVDAYFRQQPVLTRDSIEIQK